MVDACAAQALEGCDLLGLLSEGWVDGCGLDGWRVTAWNGRGCDAGVGVGGGRDGCAFEGVDELGYVLFPAKGDLAITWWLGLAGASVGGEGFPVPTTKAGE